MMRFIDHEYRTCHQLNSKWKDMSAKLKRFSVIYSNCANNRKSGMNGENTLKWAGKEYPFKPNNQTFNHFHVWVVIKDLPKFRVFCQDSNEGQNLPKFRVFCQDSNEGQSSSKITKNSKTNAYLSGGSDAHTNYAVNLEQDEKDDEFDKYR
ncbi:hypothetical protein R6Q57_020429 [Mikania cordata]